MDQEKLQCLLTGHDSNWMNEAYTLASYGASYTTQFTQHPDAAVSPPLR